MFLIDKKTILGHILNHQVKKVCFPLFLVKKACLKVLVCHFSRYFGRHNGAANGAQKGLKIAPNPKKAKKHFFYFILLKKKHHFKLEKMNELKQNG